MLKKIIIILIALILFLFAGCSNKEVFKYDYTYFGENEFWSAEYKVADTGISAQEADKTSDKSASNTILTVTYKKNLSDLAAVKQLEISYVSGDMIVKSNNYFTDNPPSEKTYTLKSSDVGAGIKNKDEIIKVKITLDGKTQIIELKNVQ